jgi:hypothetical protein
MTDRLPPTYAHGLPSPADLQWDARALGVATALALAILLATPDPASGQRQLPREADPGQQVAPTQDRGGTSLPGWAQPDRGAKPTPERPGSRPTGPGDATTNDPPLPDPGDGTEPVPLGGAEWLAGAGAAYAIRRLLQDDGEEDGDDEPA